MYRTLAWTLVSCALLASLVIAPITQPTLSQPCRIVNIPVGTYFHSLAACPIGHSPISHRYGCTRNRCDMVRADMRRRLWCMTFRWTDIGIYSRRYGISRGVEPTARLLFRDNPVRAALGFDKGERVLSRRRQEGQCEAIEQRAVADAIIQGNRHGIIH